MPKYGWLKNISNWKIRLRENGELLIYAKDLEIFRHKYSVKYGKEIYDDLNSVAKIKQFLEMSTYTLSEIIIYKKLENKRKGDKK